MRGSNGAVTFPITNYAPEPICVLLTDTRVNANGKVVRTEKTATSNGTLAHISMRCLSPPSVAIERSPIPRMRRVSIRFESKVLSITPWKVFFRLLARDLALYKFTCFDSVQELQFRYETHPNFGLEILQLLSTVLREVNPYVQFGVM
jgi:hypothetical protein